MTATWNFCHHMEAGNEYDITYVENFGGDIKHARLKWDGSLFATKWLDGPMLTMLPDDKTTLPGPIYIIGINKIDAEASIKK